jgi:O-6-methylguanine DNA methyltransferase
MTHPGITGRLLETSCGYRELLLNAASYGPHGAGAVMGYASAPSRWGEVLLAATDRGLSWIGLHESVAHLEKELRSDYSRAVLAADNFAVASLLGRVIQWLDNPAIGLDLPVDIRSTPFQRAVWQELCQIPRGETRSYSEIARRIGSPSAARAVGHANGANPLALLIPCHRAVGTNGSLTGYRWGLELKRRLLEEEAALAAHPSFSPAELSTPRPCSPKIALTQTGDKPTKIVVDWDRCESNARCAEVAPDIFHVGEDDKLEVLNENPPESARERVLKAVKVCPKQAISIVEG